VTGGGLSSNGRWVAVRGKCLFPVKVLSRLFRGKLLAALDAAWEKGELECQTLTNGAFAKLRDALYRQEWVVYAKQSFGGAQHVFSYLGRYTHRVAISNQRLLSFDDDGVRFITRGEKTATLNADEFVRRFLLHVLPPGFTKIRHFGLYAAGNVHGRLETARALLLRQQKPSSGRCHSRCVRITAMLFLVAFLTLDSFTRWRVRQIFLTGVDPQRCPLCAATLAPRSLPGSDPPALRDSS
jgi:hypothetical protein